MQLLAAISAALTPVDEAERLTTLEMTREHLSAADWQAAWAAGQRMTFQQADEEVTNLLVARS